MCYDAESGTKQALKYARHRGDESAMESLSRQLELFRNSNTAFYHVSGFTHPKLMVFTNLEPFVPVAFTWGLIPAWVKSEADAKKQWNNTLNARGESIFEKPSFKQSALHKRCLVYLDAFYEHRHLHKKTFPYRISMKDGSPMAVAGLWEEWTNKSTGDKIQSFSIVTTQANALMQKIHNQPGAEGPRMPVILPKDKQDEWLMAGSDATAVAHVKTLLTPLDEELMTAYPVGKLRGKEQLGNVEAVEKEVYYADIDAADNSPTLF
jgi:putative SOS response-associated peptidase YedK